MYDAGPPSEISTHNRYIVRTVSQRPLAFHAYAALPQPHVESDVSGNESQKRPLRRLWNIIQTPCVVTKSKICTTHLNVVWLVQVLQQWIQGNRLRSGGARQGFVAKCNSTDAISDETYWNLTPKVNNTSIEYTLKRQRLWHRTADLGGTFPLTLPSLTQGAPSFHDLIGDYPEGTIPIECNTPTEIGKSTSGLMEELPGEVQNG
ncbi:hypothetical protein MMC25_003184 [Agyrium rufum]|nr:hypothetical protein [Agyrium rufum]